MQLNGLYDDSSESTNLKTAIFQLTVKSKQISLKLPIYNLVTDRSILRID